MVGGRGPAFDEHVARVREREDAEARPIGSKQILPHTPDRGVFVDEENLEHISLSAAARGEDLRAVVEKDGRARCLERRNLPFECELGPGKAVARFGCRTYRRTGAEPGNEKERLESQDLHVGPMLRLNAASLVMPEPGPIAAKISISW
jgi:hypothetical protein